MGLENLVLAMKEVVRTHPNASLVIGGRGCLEGKLENLISEAGLEENVFLAGYIGEDSLPMYYQAADLFVLPTRDLEGFGLVTLEALACGTPVLGTPVGGTTEILSKFDKRFLLKGCGTEDIAAGIVEFIKNERDLEGLRKGCREFVEKNYSWDKFTDAVEGIFQEALGG